VIIGRFDEDYAYPVVFAMVELPQFGAVGKVEFLLDTGAYATMLSPTDAARIGVPLRALQYEQTSNGIGGSQHHSEEPALLVFVDSDRKFHVYNLVLGVMESNSDTEDLPSILGRDVLSHWCIVYDPTYNRLDAEVRSATVTRTVEEVIRLTEKE